MGFISAKASGIASGGGSGTGGYLTASKLGDGDSYRIAILSQNLWNIGPSGVKTAIKRNLFVLPTNQALKHSSRAW